MNRLVLRRQTPIHVPVEFRDTDKGFIGFPATVKQIFIHCHFLTNKACMSMQYLTLVQGDLMHDPPTSFPGP
jgi:hypothetical protein